MSTPGGNKLPPLITELLGDNSDLLEAFAEAIVESKAFRAEMRKLSEDVGASTRKSGTQIDDFSKLVVSKMHEGEDAVSTLRREMLRMESDVSSLRKRMSKEGADSGLFADFKRANEELSKLRRLAATIAPDLLDAGQSSGSGFAAGFARGIAGLGGIIIPVLVGALILATPVIAGLIGSAVAIGIGLGFAGIGVLIATLLVPLFKKQFATIGNSFQTALRFAVSGGFARGLRDALNLFNRMIPTFGKQLRTIFDALAPALVPLAQALGDSLGIFLTDIGKIIPQIMPSLLVFIETIPDVMAALSEFLITITKDGPALSRFITDAANAIAGFLHGAGEVIAWLEGAYLWLAKLHDKAVAGGWDTPWNIIKTGAKAVWTWLQQAWTKIKEVGSAIGQFFVELGSGIWAWLKDAGSAVADWFADVVGWFQKLPGRVIGFLASMPGRVIAVVKQMAHDAAYWVGWLVGTWVRFMTDAPAKIVAIVSAAWTWVVAKFKEGVAATIANIAAFPGQVGAFFAMLWTTVSTWVLRVWATVTQWFNNTKKSMIDNISSAITSVIAFFKGLPAKASAEASNFKERLVKFFKGAKDWLIEAGRDVVRGLVKGVTDTWDWAVGKVKSFGGDIAKGFKNALGIGSPSKVFAEFGTWSGVGYVQGWQKALGKTKRDVNAKITTSISGAPSGAPRPFAPPPPPGGGDGPIVVQSHLYLDSQRVGGALTRSSQRQGNRSGITGLGFPNGGIM